MQSPKCKIENDKAGVADTNHGHGHDLWLMEGGNG